MRGAEVGHPREVTGIEGAAEDDEGPGNAQEAAATAAAMVIPDGRRHGPPRTPGRQFALLMESMAS
ncbi:hypothetical protein ADENT20671_0005 [Actinomyces denticolens]|nr:hypothetical protein ADENT20671_0005 [Actinomyces denticolens]